MRSVIEYLIRSALRGPVATPLPENPDIAVVGGGLVGSSLACALAGSGLSVLQVEAADSPQAPAGFDQRKLALAQRSLSVLSGLGVLPKLAVPPTPIARIHVSRVGDFGRILLEAAEFGHAGFGGVVLAQDLGHALARRVAELPAIRRLCPAEVVAYTPNADGAELRVRTADGESVIRARCVVAADGTRSFLRQAAGIGTRAYDYGQTLFVCSLQAERASDGTAYERFSAQGPVALLPMAEGRYGSICAVDRDEADAVAALSDAAYVDYLQSRFGWRAGRLIAAGARTRYPLLRVLAERLHAGPLLLMGNAAQTIHPIGAQGFNLGLRDALSLVQVLREGGIDADLGRRYADSRREDRERTLAFSDGLARLTANPGLPMHLLRSLGLSLLGAAPGLASGLVSGAMGYRGQTVFEDVL